MTQKEQADTFIQTLIKIPSRAEVAALDAIVGQAQNQPPDGEADGSINEAQWYALRDLCTLLFSARRYLDTFNEDESSGV